ncbi:MAG: hypothetical protein O3B01_24120 [Planctomycetota bacterium]|nr:hypothetical protein [Planctomycetota bacterium]MDA1141661.1 hypothetical protein [Planctomycetota bacterium]
MNVSNDIIVASQKAPLTGQFNGTGKKEFKDWKSKFSKRLFNLLGDSSPPAKWHTHEQTRTEFDDHTRLEYLLLADDVPAVPLYLLIPKGPAQDASLPAVLCVHGHGLYGHHPVVGRNDLPGVPDAIKTAHYDYGLQFVRRGYVVAAPCMIPFGDRVERDACGSDPCAVTFVRMQALGKLLITENLRDLRWAIDFLCSRPEIDRKRIGCAGLSYGGRMSMLTAAVDKRIKVAAVSGALNLLQERITGPYSCGSQIIPGLLQHGDFSEIGSLIAPRACIWETGSTDALIVPGWSDTFRDRLLRAYRAAGKEGNLYFDRFEGGHRWNGEVAYPVFDRTLRMENHE